MAFVGTSNFWLHRLIVWCWSLRFWGFSVPITWVVYTVSNMYLFIPHLPHSQWPFWHGASGMVEVAVRASVDWDSIGGCLGKWRLGQRFLKLEGVAKTQRKGDLGRKEGFSQDRVVWRLAVKLLYVQRTTDKRWHQSSAWLYELKKLLLFSHSVFGIFSPMVSTY